MNEELRKKIDELMSRVKVYEDKMLEIAKAKDLDAGKGGNAFKEADAIQKAEIEKIKSAILEMQGQVEKTRADFLASKTAEAKETFGRWLLKAKMRHPELEAQRFADIEKAVLSSANSYAVPVGYADVIMGELYNPAVVTGKMTRFPQNEITMYIPKWLTGSTVYWVAESGVKTASVPTFERLTSTLKKMAVIVTFADELLADNNVGIADKVGVSVGQAFEKELERVALEGDVSGASDPFNGLLKATSVNEVTSDANVSYQNLSAVVNHASVLEKYHAVAEFVMNRFGKQLVMNLVDGNGRPLWNVASINGAMQETILGKTINLSDNIATTSGATSIYYGDLKQILLGEKAGKAGVEVSISNEAIISSSTSVTENLWTQDETGYRFVRRGSVVVADPTAFVRLVSVK